MNYLSRKFIFKTNLAVILRLVIYTNLCEYKFFTGFSLITYMAICDPIEENQLCAQPLLKGW